MEIQHWKKLLIPYEQAVEELKVKFNSIAHEYRRLDQYSPIEFVTGRVKKISSILEKGKKKDIDLEQIEEKVEDIAGIRIMCQFVEDIDKVVMLVRERDGKDLKIVRERDYVAQTKPSGYRSYHIIIRYPVQTAFGEKEILAELQIRTLAMNFWATIEHSLRYKYKHNMPDSIKQRLIVAAEAAFQLDREMSKIRDEIMEAQEMFQIKSNVVADILKNIQNLYFIGNIKEVGDIQKRFMDLWEEGDLIKLKQFNEQLDILAELYQAQTLS